MKTLVLVDCRVRGGTRLLYQISRQMTVPAFSPNHTSNTMNAFQKLVLFLASVAAGDAPDTAENRAERLRDNRRRRHDQHPVYRERNERHAGQRRTLRRVG